MLINNNRTRLKQIFYSYIEEVNELKNKDIPYNDIQAIIQRITKKFKFDFLVCHLIEEEFLKLYNEQQNKDKTYNEIIKILKSYY